VTIGGAGEALLDAWVVRGSRSEATATVFEHDPERAAVRGRQEVTYRWPGHRVAVVARGEIESDATTFHLMVHAAVTVDDLPHFSRHWVASVPRHLL
jgi:hypothetical protein